MKIINIYIITINTIAFTLMGIDKYKAIKNKMRISEYSLITTSIFGGASGTLLGMIIFRHKIRKLKFLTIIPLLIIIQIILYIKL